MNETHQEEFIEKRIKLKSNRTFLIKFIEFNNGCFISISEDLSRIGSLYVSIPSRNGCQTAKVIPNIRDSIFMNTLSEKISLMTNGIAMTSFSNKKPLSLSEMQEIMKYVLEILEAKTNE